MPHVSKNNALPLKNVGALNKRPVRKRKQLSFLFFSFPLSLPWAQLQRSELGEEGGVAEVSGSCLHRGKEGLKEGNKNRDRKGEGLTGVNTPVLLRG